MDSIDIVECQDGQSGDLADGHGEMSLYESCFKGGCIDRSDGRCMQVRGLDTITDSVN
jgi:hypothetical protein